MMTSAQFARDIRDRSAPRAGTVVQKRETQLDGPYLHFAHRKSHQFLANVSLDGRVSAQSPLQKSK